MKLPKALTIGGLPFRVKTGHADHYKMEERARDRIDGLSLFSQQMIFVNGDVPPGYRRVLLLHEVLHMVLGASGLDKFEEGVEEQFIGGTAALLVDTLRSNPDLVAYLLEGI